MWAQIGTLIMATSLIQLANGFFGTFISLRVAIEDFGPTMSGLVLSSYFAGFTLGALRCERIIERVGHIAPTPLSQGWSSPRPRSCRCLSDRCLG
jgi:hypothetical protein